MHWEQSINCKQAIRTLIKDLIGDDPNREGLLDTPDRIIRSWRNELFSGYSHTEEDIKKMLTVFDCEEYDEMVILKGIEFASTCEHHILPFVGVAHIAYIPRSQVVGISKLARLLEVYSRRLQIQERLCRQVTSALDSYLVPKGSSCVLEAKHLCLSCRGVNKQHSVMVTSSMTGCFLNDLNTRTEFMRLISK